MEGGNKKFLPQKWESIKKLEEKLQGKKPSSEELSIHIFNLR